MPPLLVQLPELCLIDSVLDLRLWLLHEQLHLRSVQLYVLNLCGSQQHIEVFSLLRVDLSRFHYCNLQKLPNRSFSLHKCHSHIAMPIRVLSNIKFSILPGLPIKLPIMPLQQHSLLLLQYRLLPKFITMPPLCQSKLHFLRILRRKLVLHRLQLWFLRRRRKLQQLSCQLRSMYWSYLHYMFQWIFPLRRQLQRCPFGCG